MDVERHEIELVTDNGPTKVMAACLGCFGVHRPGPHDSHFHGFVITHLPTGHSLLGAIGLVDVEEDGLQIIREISALADWKSSDLADYDSDLKAKIMAAADVLIGSPRRIESRSDRVQQGTAMNMRAARDCFED